MSERNVYRAVLFDLFETLTTVFDPAWTPPLRTVGERLGIPDEYGGSDELTGAAAAGLSPFWATWFLELWPGRLEAFDSPFPRLDRPETVLDVVASPPDASRTGENASLPMQTTLAPSGAQPVDRPFDVSDRQPVSDLVILRYQPGDQDTVVKLHFDELARVGALGPIGPWDDDITNIPTVYLEAGGDFLIAEVDGQVVGMGALKRTNERRAEIKRMHVHHAWQGNGIGRRVLQALEGRARRLGYTELHLHTSDKQLAAMNLYTSHGYREVRRRAVGSTKLIFFEKHLDSEDTEAKS